MCGRFTLTLSVRQLELAFPWLSIPTELGPRYNIAPTQAVAVVPNDGKNQLDLFRWGLIPFWAKDPGIGNRMINARSETLAEKPSFRTAFRRRRCLVLADGFFEWRSDTGNRTKTPIYIRLKSGAPFAFAGLWESWHSPDGSVLPSCTIITIRPNELLAPIHNRMPVILSPEDYQLWLSPEEHSPDQLGPLLKSFPADEMTAYPVSRLVNNPRYDSADCVIPVSDS